MDLHLLFPKRYRSNLLDSDFQHDYHCLGNDFPRKVEAEVERDEGGLGFAPF